MPNQAMVAVLKESQDRTPLQLPAETIHLSASVNAVNLENRPWRYLNRMSLSSAWLAPLNRGSLNSAHIHGTDVPVEEPSTASRPEHGLLCDTFAPHAEMGRRSRIGGANSLFWRAGHGILFREQSK